MKTIIILTAAAFLPACTHLTPSQEAALSTAGNIILTAAANRVAHEIDPQK